jgi:histone H1/5
LKESDFLTIYLNSQTKNLAPVPAAPASPPKKPAKAASAKPMKTEAPKSHPPVSDMVVDAVKTLKEHGGSSLQTIKKYLATQYKVDVEKLAPFIKKFLKSAVTKGQLLQTKGKGASESFKLVVKIAKKAAVAKPAKKAAPAEPRAAAEPKAAAKSKTEENSSTEKSCRPKEGSSCQETSPRVNLFDSARVCVHNGNSH